MARLIALLARWLGHQLAMLLLIVAVLLAGAWLKGEWDELRAVRQEIATKGQLLAGLSGDQQAIDAALRADAEGWRAQMAAATWPARAELEGLEARIARAQPQWQAALRQFGDLEGQARAARLAAGRAHRELESLQDEIYWWDRYLAPGKVLALERARAWAALLEQTARAWEKARDRVAPAIEGSPMRTLLARQAELAKSIGNLRDSVSPQLAPLRAAQARKAAEIGQVETLLGAQRERIARDPRERLLGAVRAQLPLALGILAGALLVPVLVKALFYFVLAPLASRQPPVRILPDAAAPAIAPPSAAGVSVALELAPGEELLVQSDFLQSSSLPARKQTQWLLNARLPFASVASGLFALTRITPAPGAAATRIVLAAQHDPFGEVGVIDLPQGAAMVIQPRGLAGVVKTAGQPVRITRHWRLGSLHAWLTLQLRYLVFHGPCRLVLKGCRGVRAEAPQPLQPRSINQAATLGFSANLDYRTTRTETFVSYLLGREALLNDLFAGAPGRFVYEEMPGGARRAGVTGRGLEGLTDAVLKIFGI